MGSRRRRSCRTGSPGQRPSIPPAANGAGGGTTSTRRPTTRSGATGSTCSSRTRPTTFSSARSEPASTATSVWSVAWPTQRPSPRRDSNRTSASPPTAAAGPRRPSVGGQREELGRAGLADPLVDLARHPDRRRARTCGVAEDVDAGEADRSDEVERAAPRVVVLGREADDHVAVDRDARDRVADAADGRGVVGREVAAAHPPKDAVVAGLERQVEMRHRPRRAVGPDAEQLVVDVLRLDRREAEPLDRRLVEDPSNEAGQRQGRAGVGAAEAALRPAAVVRPDVDPGQDDLAMARAQRASDVEQHGLRGEAPLRAARRRDDAVGAEERAAVLDLHERPRPLDRGPAVGDPLDLDARQRRKRPRERAAPLRSDPPGRRAARSPRAARPSIGCRRAARRDRWRRTPRAPPGRSSR